MKREGGSRGGESKFSKGRGKKRKRWKREGGGKKKRGKYSTVRKLARRNFLEIPGPGREPEIFINYIANWRVDRGREKDREEEGLKRERKEAKFVKGWCVGRGDGRKRERKERKNGGFLPFTDAGYASQQRNPRAARWEKLLNPGLTTSNVFWRAKSERFLSLCPWRNYRCRFRLSGKLSGARLRRVRGERKLEGRNKIGRGRGEGLATSTVVAGQLFCRRVLRHTRPSFRVPTNRVLA